MSPHHQRGRKANKEKASLQSERRQVFVGDVTSADWEVYPMEPEDQGKRYAVYMACCANGTLYVGYTTNVKTRLACHNAGHGGRYTRTKRPLTLVASWDFNSRQEAMLAERQLKHLSPQRKWAFAASTTLPLEEGNERSQKV